MRIRQSLSQPYIPQMVQQLGAGVQGLWSNPWARAAIDYRETNRGDVREENVVENACGGKLGSHGNKAIVPSHALGVQPSTQPLSPHTRSLAAEQQKGWPTKRTVLRSRALPRVFLLVTDAPNYRVGPRPGCPCKCLTCQSTV